MDPDVLLAQVYRVGGDEQKASLRTGIVRRVDSIKGLIDVEVAGELLRDVPYAAGLAPIVGATVWLIEQGSWFAAVSASASSGQAFAGVDEVVVGGDPPTQVSVDLWVDKSAEGTGSGWEALDNRYLPLDGGQMRGPLSLAGNPTDPLQAVPLQYLLENAGANEVHIGADAPTDPEKVLWVDTRGEPLAASVLFDSPVGAIIPFATLDSPAGWLLCDGSLIPAQFTELIALIGPNTPDLRDRFVVGAGFSYGMNARGGANEVALTEAQMPSHTHLQSPHSHGTRRGQGGVEYWVHSHTEVSGGWTSFPTDNATAQNAPTGGNQPHENRPPFHALAYHIRAMRVAPGDGGITVEDADARYVNVTGDTMTGTLDVDGGVVLRSGSAPVARIGTVNPFIPVLGAVNADASAFIPVQCANPSEPMHAATRGYVDGRVQAGTVVNTASSFAVTFPVPYASDSVIVNLTNGDGHTNGDTYFSVTSVNRNGFTAIPRMWPGGAYRCNWIALGIPG